MRIALAVQGRFHAFDLVRALIARGHDVTVFTNYPRWAAARFGLPPHRVRSFTAHGIVSRVGDWIESTTGWSWEPWMHRIFGWWADRQIRRETWDVIHAWSGVAEEIYSDCSVGVGIRIVMRGSAHIRVQAEILAQEQARVGVPIEGPSKWRIQREIREYALADRVMVLSRFAFESFISEGVPASKLRILPLGTETSAFRPGVDVIDARRARILAGAPLRVLYVGNLSFQKGLADLRHVVEAGCGRFHFRFVGTVTAEATQVVAEIRDRAEFRGRKPQRDLPHEYAWADLFVFPTIQDGYAAVLAQASAAALPILTTSNCAGPDMVHEGRTGWIIPIRSPQAFLERLDWCDSHREELAEMVTAAYEEFQTRDWSDVAADFEGLCEQAIAKPVWKTAPAPTVPSV